MFCPKCKIEYRVGFDICADCHLKLVDVLEAEPALEKEIIIDESAKFVSILSTFNLGDIALIKGILEEANIQYYFQGENFSHISGHIEPSILKVKENDITIVKELLKNFDLKFLHLSK